MTKRVVVTGLGTINALAHNTTETFDKLVKGENGLGPITQFDTTDYKVKIAGEVKDLDLEKYFDKKEIRRSDRVMLLGQIAAIEAYEDSNIASVNYDPYLFGVYVSSGIGGLHTLFEDISSLVTKGPNKVSPFFIPKSIINMTSAAISIRLGLKGPNLPIVTACSASTNAIGEAYRAIKHGYLNLAIAGGSEATINEVGIAGFSAIRALNTSNDINNASIPFDLNRDGFVMSEGAGMVILEEYEHAKNRGAKIYAEVVGYGSTGDAYHMTAPDENAEAIAKAIEFALIEAKISPKDVGYLNAHGTSTPLNDKIESLGIKKVFKEDVKRLNVSSTKSMLGHALGATGAIESIVCIKALNESIIPPTINLRNSDPECDLNYTPNVGVKKELNYAMNTNLGFGGHNAVLIFKKLGE